MRKITIGIATAALFAIGGVANAANIVETAKNAGSFNTLLAAAEAAGLVEALSAPGPLTVFAPTDEAFAALPDGTVENLLKPENKDQLVAILTYHVVGQKVMAGDIPDDTTEVETLKAGGDNTITVVKSSTGVTVDGANVVNADIAADNGVIHVIDKVILPSD
ncbi:fasciclin domain-containing protein [Stappia sp. ES.058]|uniref:fasciclin domain-containing protein n=1 Tax=Stappia sp. ES.058 TaxID=1881061 RepID=UPI00087D4680|nr:fasciclin domain-containing protein [Stappia sp. ES.058]SDT90318.1 Uncaracterized surface protein containing fasciclin (FAS1) repeats [Stappia sp. ES.058]